jgi:hypothetical protein
VTIDVARAKAAFAFRAKDLKSGLINLQQDAVAVAENNNVIATLNNINNNDEDEAAELALFEASADEAADEAADEDGDDEAADEDGDDEADRRSDYSARSAAAQAATSPPAKRSRGSLGAVEPTADIQVLLSNASGHFQNALRSKNGEATQVVLFSTRLKLSTRKLHPEDVMVLRPAIADDVQFYNDYLRPLVMAANRRSDSDAKATYLLNLRAGFITNNGFSVRLSNFTKQHLNISYGNRVYRNLLTTVMRLHFAQQVRDGKMSAGDAELETTRLAQSLAHHRDTATRNYNIAGGITDAIQQSSYQNSFINKMGGKGRK